MATIDDNLEFADALRLLNDSAVNGANIRVAWDTSGAEACAFQLRRLLGTLGSLSPETSVETAADRASVVRLALARETAPGERSTDGSPRLEITATWDGKMTATYFTPEHDIGEEIARWEPRGADLQNVLRAFVKRFATDYGKRRLTPENALLRIATILERQPK